MNESNEVYVYDEASGEWLSAADAVRVPGVPSSLEALSPLLIHVGDPNLSQVPSIEAFAMSNGAGLQGGSLRPMVIPEAEIRRRAMPGRPPSLKQKPRAMAWTSTRKSRHERRYGREHHRMREILLR